MAKFRQMYMMDDERVAIEFDNHSAGTNNITTVTFDVGHLSGIDHGKTIESIIGDLRCLSGSLDSGDIRIDYENEQSIKEGEG